MNVNVHKLLSFSLCVSVISSFRGAPKKVSCERPSFVACLSWDSTIQGKGGIDVCLCVYVSILPQN